MPRLVQHTIKAQTDVGNSLVDSFKLLPRECSQIYQVTNCLENVGPKIHLTFRFANSESPSWFANLF